MDGKRSSSDLHLAEPDAKRPKLAENATSADEIEALRRKAEGLDDIEPRDDEEPEVRRGSEKEAPDTREAPDDDRAGGPKHNHVLLFGYLGEAYQGLQRNPDAITIEPILEDALFRIGAISSANRGSYDKIKWSRSARTDKGVSAIGCIISMKLVSVPDLVEKLNQELPADIRAFGIHRVPKSFRAKNRADARYYEYIIPTSCFAPNPKRFSSEEFAAKPAFVFDEGMKKRVNDLLSIYVGTHNFFNFTSDIKADEMRVNRFVKKFWCSDPFTVDGVEFVTLSVIGQSFVLNQIRKMVAACVGIIRDGVSPDVIKGLFVPVRERNLHLAPGEGLMLREVLFETHNLKNKANPIDWSSCIPQLEHFKRTVIVPHLVKAVRNGLFSKWLEFWEQFPLDYEVLLERYRASPQYAKDQKTKEWNEWKKQQQEKEEQNKANDAAV